MGLVIRHALGEAWRAAALTAPAVKHGRSMACWEMAWQAKPGIGCPLPAGDCSAWHRPCVRSWGGCSGRGWCGTRPAGMRAEAVMSLICVAEGVGKCSQFIFP